MPKEEILEIEGIWTAEDIAEIRNWIDKEGEQQIKDHQILAEKQSKKIQEIAYVDLNELRVPFTFNL